MSALKPAFALTFPIIVLALLFTGSDADADGKRATKPRYVYVVHGVSAAKGVAKAPIDHVSAAITKAIEAEPKISHELPADAPSHKSEPEKFKRFLAKKKLEAFRVNAEVVAYKKTIEENERGRKVVVVHVDVRLFGETMPDRVMAFAGSGSSTVKLQAGRKVRDVDEKVGNRKAIKAAIKRALEASLQKLSESPKKKRRRRSKKK